MAAAIAAIFDVFILISSSFFVQFFGRLKIYI
nr:MAG TPA: hypothetical protein [Caudoviricetes sp.]